MHPSSDRERALVAPLQERVAALEAAVDDRNSKLNGWVIKGDEKDDRIAALEAALEPFSNIACSLAPQHGEGCMTFGNTHWGINADCFREARRAALGEVDGG